MLWGSQCAPFGAAIAQTIQLDYFAFNFDDLTTLQQTTLQYLLYKFNLDVGSEGPTKCQICKFLPCTIQQNSRTSFSEIESKRPDDYFLSSLKASVHVQSSTAEEQCLFQRKHISFVKKTPLFFVSFLKIGRHTLALSKCIADILSSIKAAQTE